MQFSVIDSTSEYRRRARRVRCRLENDPVGKQWALSALAKQADRARVLIPAEPAREPDSGVHAFAAAVSTALEGPVLCYSRRQELIRQAEELGIKRFDANLLIAAVQHRMGNSAAECEANVKETRSPWRFALPLGLAVGIQSFIFLGAWSLFHS